AEPLAQVVVDIFVRAHVALGVHRGTRLALVREAQARAAREIALAGALAAPLRIVGPAVAARIALARFAARVRAAGRVVVAAAIGIMVLGIRFAAARIAGIGMAVAVGPVRRLVRRSIVAIAHGLPPIAEINMHALRN